MPPKPSKRLDSALAAHGKQGVLKIGKHGDKRIRLSDLSAALKSNDDRVELTLDQILIGDPITLEGEDREVALKPINLNALAAMEAKWGRLEDADLTSMGAIRSLATIIANQDRDVGDHLTEHEVGAMLTPEVLPIVTALIADLMSPPSAESGVTSAAANNKATPRPIGAAPSTSSRRSSGGPRRPSQNSH